MQADAHQWTNDSDARTLDTDVTSGGHSSLNRVRFYFIFIPNTVKRYDGDDGDDDDRIATAAAANVQKHIVNTSLPKR